MGNERIWGHGISAFKRSMVRWSWALRASAIMELASCISFPWRKATSCTLTLRSYGAVSRNKYPIHMHQRLLPLLTSSSVTSEAETRIQSARTPND